MVELQVLLAQAWPQTKGGSSHCTHGRYCNFGYAYTLFQPSHTFDLAHVQPCINAHTARGAQPSKMVHRFEDACGHIRHGTFVDEHVLLVGHMMQSHPCVIASTWPVSATSARATTERRITLLPLPFVKAANLNYSQTDSRKRRLFHQRRVFLVFFKSESESLCLFVRACSLSVGIHTVDQLRVGVHHDLSCSRWNQPKSPRCGSWTHWRVAMETLASTGEQVGRGGVGQGDVGRWPCVNLACW